jgi:zinc protease
VEASIGETSGSVSFSCLKENLDEVLAVFKDVLTQPAFREDKIELSKTQLRSVISRQNDDASGIASREFTELIYGDDNPYAWPMTYEHIDNITRDDLAAFHRRYFFPANTTIAVQGDFGAADMKARLEKLLADWTVEQPPVPEFPKVSATPSPGVYPNSPRFQLRPHPASTLFPKRTSTSPSSASATSAAC